jgi:hypothetical protein
MSLTLRTATATNFHSFDGGDSPIESTTLVGAAQEFCEKLSATVRDYNLDNSLEYDVPELVYDNAARRMGFDMDLPYRKNGLNKVFVDYLDKYFGGTGWVEPTSGEFTGMKTCLEAYNYIVEWVKYGNEKLLETMAIKDLREATTAPDNGVDKIESKLALPFNTIVAAGGGVSKVAQDYFILLDLQEGLPIA